MNNKLLLISLMVSSIIVGIGGFIPIPAIAEPDPVFKPIIGEIRNKLPSNLVFRLPSLLPRAVTREMSPKLTFDANSERAHLDLEDENCPPRFNNKGSRAYELVCRLFSVTSSTLTSTYYQRNQIKPGSRTTAVQLSKNVRGYHLQGLNWSKVSWIQDNIYFQIYSAVPASKLIEVARSMVANSQVISRRSLFQVTQQPKSQLQTWKQFVENGGGRYIQVDYDLPKEFRNGYVYFNQGASVITAYILKQGLSSYAPINETGLGEIDVTQGDRYVKSGQAILFFWNLGNSGLQYANDTQIRFTEKGTGCFRTNCLTAPFMTNEEISRILRSKRRIEQKN